MRQLGIPFAVHGAAQGGTVNHRVRCDRSQHAFDGCPIGEIEFDPRQSPYLSAPCPARRGTDKIPANQPRGTSDQDQGFHCRCRSTTVSRPPLGAQREARSSTSPITVSQPPGSLPAEAEDGQTIARKECSAREEAGSASSRDSQCRLLRRCAVQSKRPPQETFSCGSTCDSVCDAAGRLLCRDASCDPPRSRYSCLQTIRLCCRLQRRECVWRSDRETTGHGY